MWLVNNLNVMDEVKEKKKMGRPNKPIDMDQLGALCRFRPTLKDAAAFFKVDPSTIVRACKELGKTFGEFQEEHLVHTKYDLIKQALARSEKSDTILIFCLKNLCEWTNDENKKEKTAAEAETEAAKEKLNQLTQQMNTVLNSILNEQKTTQGLTGFTHQF